MTGIPIEVRELLVCPSCRGTLQDLVSGDRPQLICDHCHLAYPVEQGIPVLLRDRAVEAPRS